MQPPVRRGLPPRIAIPLVTVFAVAFLGIVGYLLTVGFSTTGGALGAGGRATPPPQAQDVQGGAPPPAVMVQVETLRKRIAARPNDDVALTQLGDMYLAANKFDEAIPLYRRALRANPQNVAAKAGLDEAQAALHGR